MVEKPPILSDETVYTMLRGHILDSQGYPVHELWERLGACLAHAIQAQRDADVSYYEPLIEQEKELARIAEYHRMTMHYSELLAEQIDAYRKRAEQAKAEMIEEIYNEMSWYWQTCDDGAEASRKWQALKDKHLKGKEVKQ